METRTKNTITLLLGALALLCGAPRTVRAETSIKRNVLENCAAALEQAKALSADDRRALLPYLTLVLRMELSVIGDFSRSTPTPPAQQPQPTPPSLPRHLTELPAEPFQGGNLWRTFEPERESEAKQCAVTLLKEFGPLSFETVPELLILAQERSTPSDLRALVEEGARSIAVQTAKDDTFPIPDTVFSRLIALLVGETSPYATNILIEIQKRSLPLLLDEAKQPDSPRRDQVFSALLQFDPEGTPLESELVSFLDSPDETLRVRSLKALGKLTPQSDKTIGAVLKKLGDLSPDVQEIAALTLQRLTTQVQTTKQRVLPTPLSSENLAALMAAVLRPVTPLRNTIFTLLSLYQPVPPEIRDFLTTLSRAPDGDLRMRALQLRASTEEDSESRFSLLLDALYDADVDIRLTALNLLSRETTRKRDVVGAVTRLLKSDSAKRDDVFRKRLLFALAPLIPALDSPQTLLPALLDSLAFDDTSHPAPEAIATYSLKAQPALLRAVRSKDPIIRGNSAVTLGLLRPISQANIDALASLLRDANPEVVTATVEALRTVGAAATPTVERSERVPATALPAALILQHTAPFNEGRAQTLAKSLEGEPCAKRLLLARLVGAPTVNNRIEVASALLSCLPTPPSGEFPDVAPSKTAVAETFFALAPLLPRDAETLVQALQTSRFDPATTFSFLERGAVLGLKAENITSLLARLLTSEDNTLRSRALALLSAQPQLSSEVVKQLTELATNDKEEPMIRFDAAALAVRAAPLSFPYEEFFLDELKGDHRNWALVSLRKLPAETALPLLLKALGEKNDGDNTLSLLAAVASYKTEGGMARDAVLRLAQSSDVQIRNNAVITLVKIDPSSSEAAGAFRRELNSFGALRLSQAELPTEFLPTLKQFADAPQSNVELTVVKAVLKKTPH